MPRCSGRCEFIGKQPVQCAGALWFMRDGSLRERGEDREREEKRFYGNMN